MIRPLHLFCCIAFIIIGCSLHSSGQIINNVAGNGLYGYTGDGAAATTASLDSPTSIAMDGLGNIFINDQFNNCVRRVSPAGIITTVAGNGGYGYSGDGGPATNATFRANWGVAADHAGNIYITDQSNFRIRKVNTAGIITTIAGNGTYGDSGDGGPAAAAVIGSPLGIAVDNAGNVYFGDADHKCVHKISTAGIITTVAGNRSYGYSGDGGPATAAMLSYIWGLATDNAGNIYICDGPNNRVRKVNSAGTITTVAGNGTAGAGGDGGAANAASLFQPTGVFTRNGNLYIADCNNNRIRKVTPAGTITTIAGNGVQGYNGAGIPATAARLAHPLGVMVDTLDNVYLSDLDNARLRVVNNVLSFTGGDFQGLDVCENTTPISVNSLLAVRDIYNGFSDTWSLLLAPAHGTAAVAYSATSSGGIITPSGLTYTPVSGYTGTDSFKVRVANSLSSDVITIYVTVEPFVSAGVISGPSSVCVGGTITLSENTAGGEWSSNGHTSLIPAAITCQVKGVIPGQDTINYTISNTCGTIFSSKVITVNPLPDAGVVAGPATVCRGSSILLTPSVTGGTWSSSNIKATVNPGGAVVGVTPGIATIIYSVSDALCTSTVLHPVTVEIYPDAGTIIGPLRVCLGNSIMLTNAVTSGTWTSTGSVLAFTADTVSGVAVGTGDISYSVTNSCGTAVTVKSVTVDPLPDAPVVTEDQGLLSVPRVYSTYQWYVNNNVIPGANSDTTSATITGAYNVVVTNSFGCSNVSQQVAHTDCGINELLIYPNPVTSVLNFQWCKKVTVKVMCDDGRQMAGQRQVSKLDMSGLPNASYFITVFDAGGNEIKTLRITKLTK